MMTPEKLREIIAQKEGNQVEFKRSKDNLSRSVYETICAVLNRRGGHVILGAEDNGRISGIFARPSGVIRRTILGWRLPMKKY